MHLAWTISKRRFFSVLWDAMAPLNAGPHATDGEQTIFPVRESESEIELRVKIQGGTLSYSICGFFSNPLAGSSYEWNQAMGLSEWDLLDNSIAESSASLLAEILAKHIRWLKELKVSVRPSAPYRMKR